MAPAINRDEIRLSSEEFQQIFGWLTQHPDKLLLIPEVRQHLSREIMAEALKNQAVQTIEGGRVGTVKHNLAALEKGLSLERGSQLFYAIMSDSFVLKNKDYARILIIGPREESEIFALIGQGFSAKNIFGLDLMSYSPFVTLGDMHHMPFDDDSFDIVVSSFCLNYSDDAETVCREINRVLRDSGIVLIGTEAQSIHENISYWATPHKHHWTEPAHVEALFGETFGEPVFRCEPTPVSSDGFNRRIVTAFRTKKGKNYNRVIDSFLDEIPGISEVRSHVEAVARQNEMSQEALKVLTDQIDSHLEFLITRRPAEWAPFVSLTRSMAGGILDHLLNDSIARVFPPTAAKFMAHCDVKPESPFQGRDAEAAGREVREEGCCILDDALPASALRDLDPKLGWQDPAWRGLALDPWLLQVFEAHLGCAPVIIGAAGPPAPDRFEFLPGHLRSLRLFLFLADGQDMAYVRRSHVDQDNAYFAHPGWTPEEVAAAYGDDRLIRIPSKAGTLVLADGGGLLRGCGDAGAAIEIRLANSAFGAGPARFSLDVVETPYEKQLVKYFPRLFQGAFL